MVNTNTKATVAYCPSAKITPHVLFYACILIVFLSCIYYYLFTTTQKQLLYLVVSFTVSTKRSDVNKCQVRLKLNNFCCLLYQQRRSVVIKLDSNGISLTKRRIRYGPDLNSKSSTIIFQFVYSETLDAPQS